ncbi:unnamed protein product [Lymnaea stagnalis]|uniref:Uncharacterized protein n=1 Tax=Lymnaea stagnalis TaxID=6523 RepID=A0AAV2HHL0_LYMST
MGSLSSFVWLTLLVISLQLMNTSYGVKVTNIRLMNYTTLSTRVGRIEIQVDNINTWGSVCDDGWEDKDAIVACRMLGYTNGGKAVLTSVYGTGNFLFLMDDSACTGDEKNLTECTSSQNIDCTQATDVEVGVACNDNTGSVTQAPVVTTTVGSAIIDGKCVSNPTVKLYGKVGVDGMGYVQVQDPNGVFGYVCDDGWNEVAAKVVCAQLCYPTNYTAKPGIPAENKLKPANPNVILDNVRCVGNEATLQNCQHGAWSVSDCLSNDLELAGVQCVAAPYQPPPPPIPILTCGLGSLVAQFSRAQDPNLEEKHLSIWNQTCADVTKSTSASYVSIKIPVEKCSTTIARNGTHIIYSNVVKYDATSQEGAITRVNVYRVVITCALPVDKEVTQRVQAVTESVTQKATGNFEASMQIFRNDSFSIPVTESPVAIPLGEWLNMAMVMEEYDSRLELVVTDCIGTPTGNKNGAIKQVLFANKCSQESTLSFYPLTNFKFGFRFKPFKFTGYDLLYLHCDAIICLASDNTRECDRTCNNTKPNTTTSTTGRRRRSADQYHLSADSPPIVLYSVIPVTERVTPKDEPIKIIFNDNDGAVVQPSSTTTTTSGTAKPPISTTAMTLISQQNQAPSEQKSEDASFTAFNDRNSGHVLSFNVLQVSVLILISLKIWIV